MSGNLSLKSVASDFAISLPANVSSVERNTNVKEEDSSDENYLKVTETNSSNMKPQVRKEVCSDDDHLRLIAMSTVGTSAQPKEDRLDGKHINVTVRSKVNIRPPIREEVTLNVKNLKTSTESTVNMGPQISEDDSLDDRNLKMIVKSVSVINSQVRKDDSLNREYINVAAKSIDNIKSVIIENADLRYKYRKETARNGTPAEEYQALDKSNSELNVRERPSAGVSDLVKGSKELGGNYVKVTPQKGEKLRPSKKEDDKLEEKCLKERIRTVLNHGLDDKQLILLYINNLYTDSVITLYDEESAVAPKDERGSWSNILNRPSPGYLEEIVVYSVLPERQYPEVVYIEKRQTVLGKMWKWTKKKFNPRKEHSR